MKTLLQHIPPELIQFVLVSTFSLLIGLSQRRLHPGGNESHVFGTDRTFTFIGILGFILYKIDNEYYTLFVGGGLVVAGFLGIYYFQRIRQTENYGLTTILIALITYCLAPLVITQPPWLFLLIVVTILIFTELKESFAHLSEKFNREEFITLGKFLFIAGVVLPIVPDVPLVPEISLTPYRIWLAIVVISSVSYLSYLLQKFVFQDSGILISGILGGLYSSTATTLILARKSREDPSSVKQYKAAIMMAIAMMYLRIMVLVLIFNQALFLLMWPGLGLLFLVTITTGLIPFSRGKKNAGGAKSFTTGSNPLEFKVALLFAFLYIVFFLITHYTLVLFGNTGLTVLSAITGVSDIDPFLISLFQGKFPVTLHQVVVASNIAIISNNAAKMGYAFFFGNRPLFRAILWPMAAIILLNILAMWL